MITGAGSGIGRATALRLAASGAGVVCVDMNERAAERVAEECGAHARRCDVADADSVEELTRSLEAEPGPVDVLVNNAGVGVAGPFLDGSLEDWEWLRSINLDGVVHGCRSFGSRMAERGRGQVVNIASAAAYTPNRNLAAYCASKAGVFALSQCLREDWAGPGIGVRVVCPGMINTPIASHARMVGSLAGKQTRATRAFRFSHPPELVAKAIAGAVDHNRGVVTVGFESTLSFRLLRFAPGPVQALVTKAEVL